MFILRSAYVRSSSAAAAAPGGGDYSLRDNRNIRQKTPAECGMSGTATDGADKKQASDLQITAAS